MPPTFFNVFRLLVLSIIVSNTNFLGLSTFSNFHGRLLWLLIHLLCSSLLFLHCFCDTQLPRMSVSFPFRLNRVFKRCTLFLRKVNVYLVDVRHLIASILDIFIFQFLLIYFCRQLFRILFLVFISQSGSVNLREDLLRLLMIVLDFHDINLMRLDLQSFFFLSSLLCLRDIQPRPLFYIYRFLLTTIL